MSEQYFLVRKLGLGKEVVSLSLVVTEVSRGRWNGSLEILLLQFQAQWHCMLTFSMSFPCHCS